METNDYENSTPKFKLLTKEIPLDQAKVMGLGSAELTEGTFIHTRIDLYYLKKAISIMEALDSDRIDLVFANDFPIILGKLSEDKKTVTGVIIAPIKVDK